MIYVFFGHPGAGKTTLCQRFSELTGVPGIDTDAFMTDDERRAVAEGRYTQAMRLANIERYCTHVRRAALSDAALADGLPSHEAREFLRHQFPPGSVTFVLVHTPPGPWRERLARRAVNIVEIDVAGAEAYIAEHWQDPPPGWPHITLDNSGPPAALDAELRALRA